jgi:hypothetical protein
VSDCTELALLQVIGAAALAAIGAGLLGVLVGAALLGAHTPARVRYEDAEGEP